MDKKYYVQWYSKSFSGIDVFNTYFEAYAFVVAHQDYDILMIVHGSDVTDDFFESLD